MMNSIAGIVNGTHYVSLAEGTKATKDGRSFEDGYKERVNQLERVTKVKAISSLSNRNQDVKMQEFFRTEVVEDDQGERCIVLLVSNQRFRQINLEGTRAQVDEKLINPAKVRVAYFND